MSRTASGLALFCGDVDVGGTARDPFDRPCYPWDVSVWPALGRVARSFAGLTASPASVAARNEPEMTRNAFTTLCWSNFLHSCPWNPRYDIAHLKSLILFVTACMDASDDASAGGEAEGGRKDLACHWPPKRGLRNAMTKPQSVVHSGISVCVCVCALAIRRDSEMLLSRSPQQPEGPPQRGPVAFHAWTLVVLALEAGCALMGMDAPVMLVLGATAVDTSGGSGRLGRRRCPRGFWGCRSIFF